MKHFVVLFFCLFVPCVLMSYLSSPNIDQNSQSNINVNEVQGAKTNQESQLTEENVVQSPTIYVSPKVEITATLSPTATPVILTQTPIPTAVKVQTPAPTNIIVTEEVKPTKSPQYACNCSLTCKSTIKSCAQAQYLLNECGCSRLDGDKDGTACDAAPLNCQ